MASGPGWSTSHMLANGSILSDIEEQGNRVVVSLLIGSQKIVSLPIYNYFLFLMNASVSTLTTKSAKHGTCWMSHTSAKGVGHEQRGRAQRKKTAW